MSSSIILLIGVRRGNGRAWSPEVLADAAWSPDVSIPGAIISCLGTCVHSRIARIRLRSRIYLVKWIFTLSEELEAIVNLSSVLGDGPGIAANQLATKSIDNRPCISFAV